jgi:GMP synthase (glutamine-hydrolysing)
MSHGDAVTEAPAGFDVVATSAGAPVAAFETRERRLAGVQYHPEVLHSPHGQQVLSRFLHDFAGIGASWTPANLADQLITQVREQIGDGRAICGLSGGVDSAVAAALVQRAIGDRLTCVFVDHGLLRAGERAQVQRDFVAATGAKLVTVDVADRFLEELSGVTNPEGKRKIIGASSSVRSRVRCVIWSRAAPAAVPRSTSWCRARCIRTSSNPAAGPGRPTSRATTTSVAARRPEVQTGRTAAAAVQGRGARRRPRARPAQEIVARQPFPGPGLGIRIVGEVTAERLDTLRRADAIAREELTSAGLDQQIWQCPVVLLADVRSVGVQGDGRTYGHPIVLRPVSSEDAMTADWTRVPYEVLERISTRITNEVSEVNRWCWTSPANRRAPSSGSEQTPSSSGDRGEIARTDYAVALAVG